MVLSSDDIATKPNDYSDPDLGGWHHLRLRTSEEIVSTIDPILPLLGTVGFSEREMFAVRLALEEALVNAIKHGHKSDPSKEVQLRYQLSADCFLVEIEDQGPGFEPQTVPDPLALENLERSSGRGLLLIRHYMTWVRYNARGNCVTMCRQRRIA